MSDEFVLPLCRTHHREVHRTAKAIKWWKSQGIAPLLVAEALWQRGDRDEAVMKLRPPTKKGKNRANAAMGEQAAS